MSPDDAAKHLADFRAMTADVDSSASAEDLLALAESLAGRLTAQQRRVAASYYLLRLIKERHRDNVVSIERGSSRPRVQHDEGYWERRAEDDQRFYESMRQALAKYETSLRMQWTEELLASTFAMPDGTLVSWGAATVAQHTERRDMLVTNAAGNLQAAARHEAALTKLRETSAACLADAVAVAA